MLAYGKTMHYGFDQTVTLCVFALICSLTFVAHDKF